jgi:hypothetical protein
MQFNNGFKKYHRDVLADCKIYSAIAVPNIDNLQEHRDATEQYQQIPFCNSCHEFVICKSTVLGMLYLNKKFSLY